jgi:hypothetical protein
VVIKAHAYASRKEDRDVEDIYRLLEIGNTYPAEEIGGWQLDQDNLRASRRDAVAHLHELARRSRSRTSADVPQARLAALIAARIAGSA